MTWRAGHVVGEFRLLGTVRPTGVIAKGRGIRDLARLKKSYGRGAWRKLKGEALARHEPTGRQARIEVHWYEAHGLGLREPKAKRVLEWLS